jgi:hypothetical protein
VHENTSVSQKAGNVQKCKSLNPSDLDRAPPSSGAERSTICMKKQGLVDIRELRTKMEVIESKVFIFLCGGRRGQNKRGSKIGKLLGCY